MVFTRFAIASALLATLALTGCTTYVTVTSDPEGALITTPDGQTTYGYAPVDVEYDKSRLEATIDPTDPMRCARLPGFKATWQSGASASTDSPMPLCDLRYGGTVNLKRPKDAPNEEEDLRWALKRAQERANAERAERKRLENYVNTPMLFPFGGFMMVR